MSCGRLANSATASAPFAAVITRYPYADNTCAVIERTDASSSTTRINSSFPRAGRIDDGIAREVGSRRRA